LWPYQPEKVFKKLPQPKKAEDKATDKAMDKAADKAEYKAVPKTEVSRVRQLRRALKGNPARQYPLV
jgi:hypothetical protein